MYSTSFLSLRGMSSSCVNQMLVHSAATVQPSIGTYVFTTIISSNTAVPSGGCHYLIHPLLSVTTPGIIPLNYGSPVLPQPLKSAGMHRLQVRECATALLHIAKGQNIPIFLIGHVTKVGPPSITLPRAFTLRTVARVLRLGGGDVQMPESMTFSNNALFASPQPVCLLERIHLLGDKTAITLRYQA